MSQAVWFMELGGSECQTTCDVFAGGVTDNAVVADALAAFWANGLAKNCSDELKLVGVGWAGDVYDASEDGQSGGTPAAASTSYIIQKNALGKRGRFFMPGATEASITSDGRVAAATRASLDAALATELATLNAASIELRVGNEVDGFELVTSMSTRPLIGLQGRRRFGR